MKWSYCAVFSSALAKRLAQRFDANDAPDDGAESDDGHDEFHSYHITHLSPPGQRR